MKPIMKTIMGQEVTLSAVVLGYAFVVVAALGIRWGFLEVGPWLEQVLGR